MQFTRSMARQTGGSLGPASRARIGNRRREIIRSLVKSVDVGRASITIVLPVPQGLSPKQGPHCCNIFTGLKWPDSAKPRRRGTRLGLPKL
jgi:hypothetical protein